MNKEQLVKAVASKAGVSQKEANAVLKAFVEAVKEALAGGEKVQLVGFGSFQAKHVPARQGRNPKTGEPIHIPPRKKPIFKAGKALKELVH